MKFAACLPIVLIGLLIWRSAPPPIGATSSKFSAPPSSQDLRAWHPRADGIVALDGSWALYWQRLLQPGDFAAGPPGNALTVSIPAQWRSYAIAGRTLPNKGYATYRLDVALAGLQIGGDDYVTKPFEPEVLMARVQAGLRRYRAANREAGDPRPDV